MPDIYNNPQTGHQQKRRGHALSIKSDAFLKGGGYKAIAVAISAPIGLAILRHDIHNKVGYWLRSGTHLVGAFRIGGGFSRNKMNFVTIQLIFKSFPDDSREYAL